MRTLYRSSCSAGCIRSASQKRMGVRRASILPGYSGRSRLRPVSAKCADWNPYSMMMMLQHRECGDARFLHHVSQRDAGGCGDAAAVVILRRGVFDIGAVRDLDSNLAPLCLDFPDLAAKFETRHRMEPQADCGSLREQHTCDFLAARRFRDHPKRHCGTAF